MKFAVVVDVTPFTVEVNSKELVEVETVSMLVVPASMIDCRSVEVATPFMIEVSIVPEAERVFELIMLVVEKEPPRLEVNSLILELSVFGIETLVKVALVAVRFVVLVLVALILASSAVPVAVMFDPLALSKKRLVI